MVRRSCLSLFILVPMSRRRLLRVSGRDSAEGLFTEPNPIGLNTMLAMLDCAEPVFRLPYHPYSAALRAEGAKLIEEIGLEHTPGSKLLDLKDGDFSTLEEW